MSATPIRVIVTVHLISVVIVLGLAMLVVFIAAAVVAAPIRIVVRAHLIRVDIELGLAVLVVVVSAAAPIRVVVEVKFDSRDYRARVGYNYHAIPT